MDLDNASAYTTAVIEAFANQHQERLELVYLPTYSLHLNLIERLWRVIQFVQSPRNFPACGEKHLPFSYQQLFGVSHIRSPRSLQDRNFQSMNPTIIHPPRP